MNHAHEINICHAKGLSVLQRRILQLALAQRERYGDTETVYQAEILAALYGLTSDKPLRDPGRKFNREAIGRAIYNRANAAVSRATGRLMRRGLLDEWCGQRAGGPARYSLTPAGIQYARSQRLNESQNVTVLTVPGN
jgi:hypothetical protein